MTCKLQKKRADMSRLAHLPIPKLANSLQHYQTCCADPHHMAQYKFEMAMVVGVGVGVSVDGDVGVVVGVGVGVDVL